jgi:hypothetical protein
VDAPPIVKAFLEQVADLVAGRGFDVSIRVYEHVAADEDQPDPVVDVWRTAIVDGVDDRAIDAFDDMP